MLTKNNLTIVCLLAGVFLTACASRPIKTEQQIATVSVKQVRTQLKTAESIEEQGADPVLWGGVIISTQNLADETQVEVMAYPLDRRQRPMTGRDPEGRFLIRYDSFLEPVDYAEGRAVSVLGELSGITTGTVGEAQYEYPTVDATEIHLWSEKANDEKPRVTFGIGVNFGL